MERFPKFEEMSGFKELEEQPSKTSGLFLNIVHSVLEFIDILVDIMDTRLFPFIICMAILFLIFNLVFYSADMIKNIFNLFLLGVLFYIYKNRRR